MEVSSQLHALAALLPRGTASGTHWMGGWVSPRAGWMLWIRAKFLVPAGNRNSAVQLIAHRYTYSAIPVLGYGHNQSVLPLSVCTQTFRNRTLYHLIKCSLCLLHWTQWASGHSRKWNNLSETFIHACLLTSPSRYTLLCNVTPS
jgi:hypothetical protein